MLPQPVSWHWAGASFPTRRPTGNVPNSTAGEMLTRWLGMNGSLQSSSRTATRTQACSSGRHHALSAAIRISDHGNAMDPDDGVRRDGSGAELGRVGG